MWFFVLIIAFTALGMSRRPAGAQAHLAALLVIMVVIAYAAASTHAM